MNPVIRIVPASDKEARLWTVAKEVAELLAGIPWVLIGGLMVTLIEREHGASVGRATVDVDALVDVRAVSGAARDAAARLSSVGFVPQPTPDGLAYRFIRANDIVDVLAPDNLGPRADLQTVPPNLTLAAPGGRQALARRRVVIAEVLGDTFELPVPTLVGALLIKARAAAESRTSPEKHRRDLARLLALVDDVEATRSETSDRERRYLRVHDGLRDLRDPAWRGIADAEDAIIALERLIE